MSSHSMEVRVFKKLEYKPIVNLCLCVRGIHLASLNAVLDQTDRTITHYIFVGRLYNKERVITMFRNLYPSHLLVFPSVDEEDLVEAKDVMLHVSISKYAFVEIDMCFVIDPPSIRYDLLSRVYGRVTNTNTNTNTWKGPLSFVNIDQQEMALDHHLLLADVVCAERVGESEGWYILTPEGRYVEFNDDDYKEHYSDTPMAQTCDIEEQGSGKNEYAIRVRGGGYLGAPNRNHKLYLYHTCGPHTRFIAVAPGIFLHDGYQFDKSVFEVVVARYTESIRWSVPYQDVVTFYNKAPYVSDEQYDCKSVPLPNVGREAHTYLHHIIHNYDKLANNTLFTQGGMGEHDTYGIEAYMFTEAPTLFLINNFGTIYAKDRCYGFLQHKGKWLDEYNTGKMLPEKNKFNQWWTSYVRKRLPHIRQFKFSHGAIFSVSKSTIRSNSAEYYKHMIETVEQHSNPETGHYFERAWYYIFGGGT